MSDNQVKTWLRHRLEVLAWHCKTDKGGPKKKLGVEEINRRLHALVEEADRRMRVKASKAPSGVLAPIGKNIAVKVAAKHTPSEYFANREGLYVWSDFKERILVKATPTKSGASFKVSSFKLEKAATDEEIEGSLPKKHLFSETDVCAIVAELIAKQPKGEEGVLQNNGWANLFYTESCVVSVDWDSGDREWHVDTWLRVGHRWDEDTRVFSPAR